MNKSRSCSFDDADETYITIHIVRSVSIVEEVPVPKYRIADYFLGHLVHHIYGERSKGGSIRHIKERETEITLWKVVGETRQQEGPAKNKVHISLFTWIDTHNSCPTPKI